MRTAARFPAVPEAAGHYESFYVKAAHPRGGRAVWLRHTVHKRPGAPPTGSLWLTVFDAEQPGPWATKQTFPQDEVSAPSEAYIRVGPAVLEPGRAHGAVAGETGEASWELSFEDRSLPLHHLPYELLYRTRLPRTKVLSPYPCASFSGSFQVGEERIELEGWPGMIGHNWGAEHAEQWIWIQASALGGDEDAYLDIAAGRIRVGPMTTPWVANGRISIEGEQHRLGGFRGSYGTEIAESARGCEFTVPGKGVNVKGKVGAAPKDFVAWVYADPEGPEHHALNCSISDLELKVERPGKRHARLEVASAAAYELGTRETDHGVPLQPYPDG